MMYCLISMKKRVKLAEMAPGVMMRVGK